MQILSLNGPWRMRDTASDVWHEASVPGSVYADLLRDGTIQDPFWRENEYECFDLLRHEWEYVRTFSVPESLLSHDRVVLRCLGLDTLCDIYLNDIFLASCDNMHVAYGFEVRSLLQTGENTLRILFHSPIEYVLGEYKKRPCWGSTDAIPGFGHLRKAHMMFGWDWGPRLPDAGIWQDIQLEGIDGVKIDSILVEQDHQPDGSVVLHLRPDYDGDPNGTELKAVLECPDGSRLGFHENTVTVTSPELWWPRGYGAQPLYTIHAVLERGGRELDRYETRVGLRVLTVSRSKDEWGEEFCHMVNGVKVFAMGGDYIPEDNIFSRVTPERTRRLLEDAALANFNTIRVWGGGYYPSDAFYDICDELGLMVWQDLMYACSFYDLTPAFEESIRVETVQQVRRLRNHPSLALICGNNEMEGFMAQALTALEINFDPRLMPSRAYTAENTRRSHVADYIKMYEYLLPGIVKTEAPQTFWWPSSPSSGGAFDNPSDFNRGDVHYWDVWHGEKPFTEYRKFYFRYASEFGFQSFPCLETVESFTLPEDRNIFSRIMERHQRNKAANGKILSYLSQTFQYPASFDMLLYASQLLQAEAIRYGVEHWRRHRGRCMGAIIWQLNDCWPVASWSSIDYYGRWKALHYVARRFFAPVLLSVHEEGELSQNPKINEFHPEPIERSARMNLSNETMNPVSGTVQWALRDASSAVLQSGSFPVTVPPLSSVWLPTLSFPEADLNRHYFSCEFVSDTPVAPSTALFCAPKHFCFADPQLSAEKNGDTITVHAASYARMVRISSEDPDLLLSDNYFDMNAGSCSVRILRGTAEHIKLHSVYDIR